MNEAPDTMKQLAVSHTPKEHNKKKKRGRKGSKKSHVPSDQHSNYSSSSSSDDNSSTNNKSSPSRRRKRQNRLEHPEMTLQEKDRFVAMDCEMVGVGYGGHRSALARVCIINWNGKKLLDTMVRPAEPVTDFRTFVSGITEEDFDENHNNNVMELDECRVKVRALLRDKILVGHALKNDLHALGMSHPWFDTRDTGKYEPFMKVRFDDGILWPRKLKELAKEKLGRDIQREGDAHSAFVDAKTALDLYKLVRNKWEKAMQYKTNKTSEIERLQKLNAITTQEEEPALELAQ